MFESPKSKIGIEDPEDPRFLKIHAERLIQRDITMLTGICELYLQDGLISQDEAEAIFVWLRSHAGCLDTWPASILYDRLRPYRPLRGLLYCGPK